MLKTTLDLLNNFSVLVVEDDHVARTIVKQAIKDYCGEYFEAKDGYEGLEAFKRRKVDIIIVDIHLPRLNGFDMIKEILTLKPEQPFVIITAYDNDQNVLASIQTGAFSFLRKPIDIKDLQTALLLALSQKMKQKQVRISDHIMLDYKKEVIYKDDEAIFLTQTSHKIFWLLCYNMGRLVSYEMIEDYVYNGESVNKNTIHAVILRIKKQLDDVEIDNIANTGYILRSKHHPMPID
jgi:DNA-binding response OmpR family regulator